MSQVIQEMKITLQHKLEHIDQNPISQLAAPDQQQRELNILIIVQLLKKSIGITNQCVE